jgi:hypothetical protein
MNRPQQSLATLAPPLLYGLDSVRNGIDEDVPLGCECADPALQIDCWGEEAGARATERD